MQGNCLINLNSKIKIKTKPENNVTAEETLQEPAIIPESPPAEELPQPDAVDAFIATNPPLLTNDKIVMNEYIELCRSRNLRQQLRNYQEAQQLAIQIIAQLKDEYHL